MILRPALAAAKVGLTELERALDEERRTLMKLNEVRLQAYAQAGRAYLKAWPLIASRIANMPLIQAHTALLAQAEQLLPEAVKL